MTTTNQDSQPTILFFDGVCGLCNKTVDQLLRIDHDCHLRFAPLQGPTAEQLLPAELVEDLDTVVLWHQGQAYQRSRAILNALVIIGFPWSALGIFKIVPRFLADPIYRFIARNRYRWFGKRETCRLPTSDERARFLP